jgi:predicted membrane protein
MREHRMRRARFAGSHATGTHVGGRLWFGIVILGLGILWTLDNLRFIDSDRVLEWWPLVLIAFGLSKLWERQGARPLAAALWVGLGMWLLGHNLGLLPWGIGELWPVVLIVVGISIIRRALHGPRTISIGASEGGDPTASPEFPGTDTFSCTAIWAGVDRTVTSQAFRGGDFTAIMGGGEVDLRGARPVPGGAVVDVFVVMGGLQILVPEDWQVVNQLYALMGGVEDSRSAAPAEAGSVLYLNGTVVMGGIEIKN